jgi:hypothetical protein
LETAFRYTDSQKYVPIQIERIWLQKINSLKEAGHHGGLFSEIDSAKSVAWGTPKQQRAARQGCDGPKLLPLR